MPQQKHKKRKADTDTSDSGPDDADVKPSKSDTKAKKEEPKDDEEPTWVLENKRMVKVREFRGKVMVDIREYYSAPDGDLRPGKKGISLSTTQWRKLCDSMKEIDEVVQKRC